jgi:hypothetical protein
MPFAFHLGQAILDGPDGRRQAPAARLRLPAATRPDPGSPELIVPRFNWLLGMGNPLMVSTEGGRAGLFHFENERCGRDRRRRMSDTAGQIS